MAVTLTWTVKIGPIVAPTDFTNRVLGFDLDQQLQLNTVGSFRATITLKNTDGALTPNGGGTYQSVDWFAQGVFLRANVSALGQVKTFDGIITGFDLFDDGEYSTVTLTVDDVWTVGGRSLQGTVAAIASQAPSTYISNTATYGQFSAGFPFTNPGTTTYTSAVDITAITTTQVTSTATATGVTYADLLNQIVMPSQNGFMWPSKLDAPTDTYIEALLVGSSMTKSAAYRRTFVFDPPSAISGTDLPITALRQGWNTDQTINTATQTSLDQPFGAIPITATDTTATGKYGSRAVTFNQTACPAGTVTSVVTELVNRFKTPTFGPIEVTLTASSVKAYCANAADQALADLLDFNYGFLDKAIITWTGAGAASQTANCVILGKRIRATPSDTEIVLSLGKWADFHSFILDTDKLDTDRLG